MCWCFDGDGEGQDVMWKEKEKKKRVWWTNTGNDVAAKELRRRAEIY